MTVRQELALCLDFCMGPVNREAALTELNICPTAPVDFFSRTILNHASIACLLKNYTSHLAEWI